MSETGYVLPFGKHRDKPLADVPDGYLSWLLRECKLSSGLRQAVRAELLRRGADPAGLPPESPPPPPPRCRHCGARDVVLFWHELAGQGGRTIRAECGRCRRFVTFVAQTAENVAAADAAKSKTGTLDVLLRADVEGVRIVNLGGRLSLVPYQRASAELRTMVRQNTRLLLSMLPAEADEAARQEGIR